MPTTIILELMHLNSSLITVAPMLTNLHTKNYNQRQIKLNIYLNAACGVRIMSKDKLSKNFSSLPQINYLTKTLTKLPQ